MLENRMLIDSEWEREYTDWEAYYKHLAEEDDRRWEDNLDE